MRQRREGLGLEEGDSVLRKKVLEHLSILPGDRSTQNSANAHRQAKVDSEAVDVRRPGARAGAEDHLVVREVADNLVDQRHYGAASAVHDSLAADLDDIHPRQDGEIRRRLGGALQRRVAEGSADKPLAELCEHGIIDASHVAYSPENLNTRSSKRCVSGNIASRPPNCVWAHLATG